MAQALAEDRSGESNPVDETGLCLLSLDDGGVRGLSTLYILKGLMVRPNHEHRDQGLPAVKPCELFDLIGGTSTGGLIAIMLGRLEMDVDECISAYRKLMGLVFGRKPSWSPVDWTGGTKPRFDSMRLKNVIEDVVTCQGIPKTDLLNDGQPRGCKVFVCATAKELAGITRLRSYSLPDELDIPATICDAALATSAATGFFNLSPLGHEALELLQELTFLPLAIVQAAAYIYANGATFSDHLSVLKEQEQHVIDLLSEDFEDEGQYQEKKNPIATTWLVSFEHIRRLCPLAAQYLSFMCCIHPRDIPVLLLPPAQVRKKETDAIGTLSAYSFVSRRSADNFLDLHRLVHLATRNWLRKEESLAEWTLRMVARLGEVLPNGDRRNRSLWTTYLPHAQYVLDSSLIEDAEETVALISKFGICLVHDGRYNKAEKRLLPVVEMNTRRLGKEHPNTLDSIGNLALTYTELGQWEEAEELQVHVIEIRKSIFGEEHRDTLSGMHNLALTYSTHGRWEEAEELGIQVMKTMERILGKEDPNTLSSMSNLAVTYRNQGRLEEAEDLDMQVLEMRKMVLGKNHPDTLNSMDIQALTYSTQGRCKEGEELGIQVLEKRRRVLGEEHPNTLNSMGILATTYGKQGRWEEAEELWIQVIETREKVLGKKHPSTLKGMAGLAVIYFGQRRWKEGENLEVQVLEMQKRVLREDHIDTLQTMHNLAYTWRFLGRDIEAWRLMEKCFEGQNQKLGADHPHTIASREKLLQWVAEDSLVDSSMSSCVRSTACFGTERSLNNTQ